MLNKYLLSERMNISSEIFKNKKVVSECKTLSLHHAIEFSSRGILLTGDDRTVNPGNLSEGRQVITECSSVCGCLIRYFQKGFKSKARMPKVY